VLGITKATLWRKLNLYADEERDEAALERV
jgi:hypothetical protein